MMVAAPIPRPRRLAVSTGLSHSNTHCWIIWGLSRCQIRSMGPISMRSRGRRIPVKQFIMDGKVVVGVGNIYANEALFMAGIHPAEAPDVSRWRVTSS